MPFSKGDPNINRAGRFPSAVIRAQRLEILKAFERPFTGLPDQPTPIKPIEFGHPRERKEQGLVDLAWEVGQTAYMLRNSQRELRLKWKEIKKTGRKFYVEATRRLGKSSWLLAMMDEAIRLNAIDKLPPVRCVFFAPVKDGLTDYIMPVIEKVFADCPNEHRPKFNSRLVLTYPDGSEIMFRGANMKQHRLRRGGNIFIAGLDEARDIDELNELLESVVLPSLFSSNGYLIISSTPADSTEHPLYAYRMAAEQEGWLARFDIYDANKLDPEVFPLDRIEEWKKETKDPVAWQREYLALWVRDPKKVIIPDWQPARDTILPLTLGIVKKTPEFKYFRYFESVDFGMRDLTVCLIGFYHYTEATLYVEREIVVQGTEMNTQRFGERLFEVERDLGLRDANFKSVRDVYMRVSDSDPGSLLLGMNLIESHGITFYPTDKERLHAMVNKANILVAAGRVKVSSECKLLLGSLAGAEWNEDKTEFKRTALFGHADAIAALVYMIRNLVDTNPIPAGFDVQRTVPDTENFKIPWVPRLESDKNRSVLENALGFNRLKGTNGQTN